MTAEIASSLSDLFSPLQNDKSDHFVDVTDMVGRYKTRYVLGWALWMMGAQYWA
jgi:hypothetical protein